MTRPACIVASLLFVAGGGCLLELPDTIKGEFWCAKAFGANGTRINFTDIQIIKNGSWITGCQDMCPFQIDILEEGEEGNIGEMDPLYDDWQTLRQEVFNAATSFCEIRVDQLEAQIGSSINFNSLDDITCQEASEASNIFVGGPAHIPPSDCDAMEGDGTGEEQGSGPSLYGLTAYSEVLNCSGTTNITCNVDQEFIADMLAQPELVWSDDAFLQPYSVGGTTGFKFQTCASSSLMYAMGFRVNDVMTHVDGMAVTTDPAVGRSFWGHLGSGQYTSAVATFKRNTTTHTLTVVKVNLPSYP